GFPPGEGVEVGLESERQVRAAGAVPATVGVLGGEVRVGLTEEELGSFGPFARKVGPRDLAAAAVQGTVGATTVGGTLTVARAVGARTEDASKALVAQNARLAGEVALEIAPAEKEQS